MLGHEGAACERDGTAAFVDKAVIAIEPIAEQVHTVDADGHLIDFLEPTDYHCALLGDVAVSSEKNTVAMGAFETFDIYLL